MPRSRVWALLRRLWWRRRTSKTGPDGMPAEAVRPYLMDLGSTNGTFINGERLEAQRFYELMEKVGASFLAAAELHPAAGVEKASCACRTSSSWATAAASTCCCTRARSTASDVERSGIV